ncbi:hypothetical protein A33M_1806 [Rhodovulum sp. PH10]|uniref:hypothetical protein n=1 Tax=Rhodovulum sp. PH10 TaxID=1187851 RepID=UPI00027C2628|nr:hypothetical protein [Rhodovulum sp. PH10]EJW12655.1 hypothetical protein A33M_1806 [Rhodovulum sp. PH10]
MSGTGKDAERSARERRLAEALRKNLQRRKAQSRARAGEGQGAGVAPGGVSGGADETHDSAGIADEKDPD